MVKTETTHLKVKNISFGFSDFSAISFIGIKGEKYKMLQNLPFYILECEFESQQALFKCV